MNTIDYLFKMDLSLFANTNDSQSLDNLTVSILVAKNVKDFCLEYYATTDALYGFQFTTNAWNKQLAVNQKLLKQVKNALQVS